MGGSAVQFQTNTPVLKAITGAPNSGTLFPAAGLGWPGTQTTGPGTPFFNALTGINDLSSYGDTSNSSNALTLSNAGTGAIGSGQSINSTVSPYISQALQQGFDPQSQLFTKLFQQQQDQSNAENAMAGVATTPYGAALTSQGNQNFDLAWQQQQLANQAQGANTAATLAGTGMGALTSGLGAAGNAINTTSGISNQQIQDYLNYIMGNVNEGSAIINATNNTNNASSNMTNSLVNAQNASNAGKSGIGSGLSGIGSLIGAFT